MAINGQIVDEINGLIASRDSIRTTMKAANIASDTSKLADLATNLAAAKLGATTYNVSSSNQTIPAGKLTTGAQIIRAVTTSGIEAANIKSGTTITVGDAGSAGRIKNVTGTFTNESANPITADSVLSGKIGYVNGVKVTGSMPNGGVSVDAAGTLTKQPSISRQSITNISGITDAAADNATTTAPTSSSTYKAWVKVNSAANTASYTPSATKTAGYISGGTVKGTAGTYGAAASADTYIPIKNGGISVAAAGTLTKQPSISRQSISISNVTDAAAGNATTTSPTSGVWVKVNSAANTASYTPSATKTEGWVSGGSVTGTAGTYGASASKDTYIPIKNGAYSASVSTTAGSASMSAAGVSTATSSNCYITLSTTAGSATGKATVGTAGWVATGSTSSSATSVSVSGNGTKLYLATYTPSTITVTNSSQTLSTNGKVCTGNITIPAVNYFYTSPEIPSSTSGYNDGDIWLVVNL